MLKPLTTWLANEAGLAIGVTLFPGERPAKPPSLCTTIREIGPEVVDATNKDRRVKSIQLITEGPSYFGARDEATRIFEIIVNRFGLSTVDGWTVFSTSGTAPQDLPTDVTGRYVFVANVVIRAKRSYYNGRRFGECVLE